MNITKRYIDGLQIFRIFSIPEIIPLIKTLIQGKLW